MATDALAVEVLEPDEVARVNGLMFAAKRVGIIFGGAVLGVLITKIGISGVIAAQLVMLAFIIMVPLFMVEKPGVQLFPWSRTRDDTDSQESRTESGALVAEPVEDSEEAPWEEEEEFRVARIVGYSIANKRVSISSIPRGFGSLYLAVRLRDGCLHGRLGLRQERPNRLPGPRSKTNPRI